MNIKEATKLIKKYILENFDDKWYPNPTYLEEYPDFYDFGINTKKYVASGNFLDSFVGLSCSYLSKKYGEIVQYGSGLSPSNTTKDFLKTEHKLSIIRTKYKIKRPNYYYSVEIQNITSEKRASKYIDGIWVYSQGSTFKEMHNSNNYKFTFLNYFGLLNLLYFNTINPFCDISYKKELIKGHDDRWLRTYSCVNDLDSEDLLFQNYMLDEIIKHYPAFDIDTNYSSNIIKIYDINKLHQYIPIADFKYYGEDDLIGYTGYINYSFNELNVKIRNNNLLFEFVEAKNLLFFLFINSIIPFCKIEIERIPDDLKIH